MKIGLIGAGNMGAAMIAGYLRGEGKASGEDRAAKCADIFAADREQEKREVLHRQFGVSVCEDNKEVARQSDILILAVKPHVYETVLREIKDSLKPAAIVVSIAAGISIAKMQRELGGERKIIRTMPNTPCLVGEGMIALTPNVHIGEQDLADVTGILGCCAKTEIVPEALMDAVGALSGSSPAYTYMLIEAMSDGAVAEGMPREQAYRFAAQAVLGAAKMVLATGQHPGELKDAVCSPGGSTIEAVHELERGGFRSAVMQAVRAAAAKNRRMDEGNR